MATPKRAPTRSATKPEAPAVVRRKDEDQLKTTQLHIRITATQKEAMTRAAARKGLDLSSWVRMTLLDAAGALPKE